MRKLGVSIYPGHSDIDEDIRYLELASGHGFQRVFTCLLSVEGDREEILDNFKRSIERAGELGMEVIADISPKVFRDLDISYTDLSFFKELGVYGIRLDMGFTGNEESLMTFNPYGLRIEVTMGNDTRYIDTIMDYMPDRKNLLGCHNFYPHRYTGLGRDHFRRCNANFRKHALETAAFVTSADSTFGPWPVTEGMCTLEEHRDLPIEIQGRDLFLEGIDTVIIADCYASEDELRRLGEIDRSLLELEVTLEDNLDEIQERIVREELHFNRGDVNENLIRSTQSRVKYRGHEFPLINARDIERGDIIIESSLYGHYAGELQIAKAPMKNSGRTSIVGRVASDYLFFLDRIAPWQKFRFKVKDS